MNAILHWLGIMALVAATLAAFAWLGHAAGTRAARKYPSLAMALFIFNGFFKLDPPPPPTMETIADGEEDEAAGDPPDTTGGGRAS